MFQKNPAQVSERIRAYDAARGLAVFGMVLVNYTSIFAGCRPGGGLLSGIVDLLYGRAAVLFVVLAGIGVVLLGAGRKAAPAVRSVLARRALALFALGYAFFPWWKPDILHFYGVFLLAAAGLTPMPPLRACMAGVAILSANAWFYGSGDGMPTLEHWTDCSGLWCETLDDWLLKGFYPVFPWLGFFLLGMALEGGQVIRRPGRRRRMLVAALGLFAAAECASGSADFASAAGIAVHWGDDAALLLSMEAFPASPLWSLSSTGTAMLLLGLIAEAATLPSAARWLPPLERTGRMTLTFYLLHILVGIGLQQVLESAGREDMGPAAAAGLSALFCAAALVAAGRWLRTRRRGPMEWLMRRLSGSHGPPPPPAAVWVPARSGGAGPGPSGTGRPSGPI